MYSKRKRKVFWYAVPVDTVVVQIRRREPVDSRAYTPIVAKTEISVSLWTSC